jgi:hypothetical protein
MGAWMGSVIRSSKEFRPIVRSRSPKASTQIGLDRDIEPARSLDRLLDEALALCGTVDPDLQAVLASVLEGRHRASVKFAATSGDDPTATLLTSFHMFTYACAEARSLGRETVDVRRLEMCTDCLVNRLKLAAPDGIGASPAYS